MSAVTCPPLSVGLPLHLVPHEELLRVAERKYLWLEQLKVSCAVSCAGGQRNNPQSSPPISTSVTRQWPAGIQRSAGAAPGREGCRKAKSPSWVQWCGLLPTRNLSSCVLTAPARVKEKQQCFHHVPKCQLLEASTGSQGNSPPTAK